VSQVYASSGRRLNRFRAQYRVDFWAWNAFFICMVAGMFLSYWFIVAQTSSSPQLMLYTANFVIFMILLVGGLSMLMVLWTFGVVSFDYNLDFSDLGSTLLYGVAFAGIMSLATLPIVSFYGQNLSYSIQNSPLIPTLLAPGGEEFWNNGGVYGFAHLAMTKGGLGDGFGPFMPKGAVRGVTFAVSHFWAYTLTPGTFLFIFTDGFILSFSYWYTKKLGVPIIAHLTWNLIMLHAAGVI
jgi:membrane protease YdiL (CAAX protease family)